MERELLEFFEIEEFNNAFLKPQVDVSIWCVTYNHREFIEKTIKGFLSQETTFNYEVVIFDDASTDGTREIVKEYAKMYPQKILTLLPKKNTYNKPNRKRMIYKLQLKVLRGKYAAWCEGDDYWIYNKKLQRQYELMESDIQISMCFHNAIRLSKEEVLPQIIDMDSKLVDDDEIFLCRNGRPPTASFFYRTNLAREIEESEAYMVCPVGDDSIRFFMASKGKIFYLDKCWCVRNYMHEGSWNKKFTENEDFASNYRIKFFKYYELFDAETNKKYFKQTEEIRRSLCIIELESSIKQRSAKEYYRCANDLVDILGESSKSYLLRYVILHINKFDDYVSLVKLLTIGKKVYVYGAGIEANKVYKLLTEEHIDIDGFVVTDLNSNPSKLMGKDVYELNDIKIDNNYYFVLGMNDTNKAQVIDTLLPMTTNII